MYDYIAQVLNDAQPLIQQLSKQEQLVVDTRKSRDKNLQLQAEDKCRELRKQLLKSENTVQEASFYFHFLATEVANSDEFRSAWQNMALSVDELARLRQWNLEKFYKDNWHAPTPDLSLLPPYSFFLQFTFTLAKPYISRDDNLFYIIDNPIVRDKVFGLPMVRPTAWKGNLYSALWQMGHDKQDDEQMQRLFGETRSEESGQAGRLYFYPTFFTQTGLEIINPHDRKRRVGKNPILFESVPAGASGTFSLLYVPLDLIGEPEDKIRRQAIEDLQRVAEGLQAMFLTYGFSAKRTSGYGVANQSVSNGFFQIRVEEPAGSPSPTPSASEPSLPKYLQAPGKLKDEYLNPDGTFRERSQAELAKMTKSQEQEYKKAKKWWEREGKALSEQPPAPAETPPKPAPRWFRHEFATFEEMLNKVKEAEQALIAAGGEA